MTYLTEHDRQLAEQRACHRRYLTGLDNWTIEEATLNLDWDHVEEEQRTRLTEQGLRAAVDRLLNEHTDVADYLETAVLHSAGDKASRVIDLAGRRVWRRPLSAAVHAPSPTMPNEELLASAILGMVL